MSVLAFTSEQFIFNIILNQQVRIFIFLCSYYLSMRDDYLKADATNLSNGEKEVEKEDNLRIIRLKSLRKYEFKSNIIEMLSWANHAKKFLNNHLNNETYDIVIANYALPSGMVAKHIYELAVIYNFLSMKFLSKGGSTGYPLSATSTLTVL